MDHSLREIPRSKSWNCINLLACTDILAYLLPEDHPDETRCLCRRPLFRFSHSMLHEQKSSSHGKQNFKFENWKADALVHALTVTPHLPFQLRHLPFQLRQSMRLIALKLISTNQDCTRQSLCLEKNLPNVHAIDQERSLKFSSHQERESEI